ncbi:glycosyltransferase [Acaryochloris sp. IP29b_bin.148]|uniref:glycosyltransferase n=1 Tax=Acaryochloris sp. IP29b_bin.148 TaxID=2969218 RepID=UPI002629A64A|nr:glycosyltransferase [Acaryochloris sp. IP29b_bin.148]
MDIAFIVGKFPVASETFILNQIIGLIDRGHNVDVYAKSPNQKGVIHQDIEVYQLQNSTYYDISLSSNLVKRQFQKIKVLLECSWANPRVSLYYLNPLQFGKQAITLNRLCLAAPAIINKKSKYDVIQCHFGLNGLRGLSLRNLKILQGKLVVTFHGSDVSKQLKQYGNDIYTTLWSEADYFLPISEHWKDKIISLGCDEHKTTVHHMGIDCSRFKFKTRSLQADLKVQFVSVCRLVEKKGIEYSIRAIAALVKTHPNVQYTIVGDGIQREYLQHLIRELGMEQYIHLLGWKRQDEVVQILDQSDILVAPSITSQNGDQEGIPVALMEAMAMGMPVVSTFHSGIPELVKDGVSGCLVPEKDVDGLLIKLKYLVENTEEWAKLGKAGRDYVEDSFNIQILNNHLETLYKKLIH